MMKASLCNEVINLQQLGETTFYDNFIPLCFNFFLTWDIYVDEKERMPQEHPGNCPRESTGCITDLVTAEMTPEWM